MKHEILLFPDPRLRRRSRRMRKPNPQLAADLRASLPDGALGLAAPQLGINQRAIIWQDGEILWNPKIVGRGQTILSQEGCLSLSGELYEVERWESVLLSARDERWSPQKRLLGGLDAVVLQHEVDHLNGILICDRGRKIELVEKKEVA